MKTETLPYYKQNKLAKQRKRTLLHSRPNQQRKKKRNRRKQTRRRSRKILQNHRTLSPIPTQKKIQYRNIYRQNQRHTKNTAQKMEHWPQNRENKDTSRKSLRTIASKKRQTWEKILTRQRTEGSASKKKQLNSCTWIRLSKRDSISEALRKESRIHKLPSLHTHLFSFWHKYRILCNVNCPYICAKLRCCMPIWLTTHWRCSVYIFLYPDMRLRFIYLE